MRWKYTVGWALWAALGVALEITALVDAQPGDTLSEHLRFLLGSHPLVWFVGLGAAAWAAQHIFWRRP